MAVGTADKTNQDTGQGKVGPKDLTALGAGLEKGKGGAETKPEKLYKQSEVDALLGGVGQRKQVEIDSLTKERDSLKSQLSANTTDLEDNKAEIEKLQAKFDDLSSDDPAKFDAAKELKAGREERKQLKADRRALEDERVGIAEFKNERAQWNRDQLVYQVADEFVLPSGEAVDPDTFKKAADKLKLKEREELVALAEEKGFKLKAESTEIEPATVLGFPGKTYGGSDRIGDLPPAQWEEALKKKLKTN